MLNPLQMLSTLVAILSCMVVEFLTIMVEFLTRDMVVEFPMDMGMACPHLLDIQFMDIILPTLAMLTQHMELLETMEQLDGHCNHNCRENRKNDETGQSPTD